MTRRALSEEWLCEPRQHVSRWPGSANWTAQSGPGTEWPVTLWCTDCGGNRPHYRTRTDGHDGGT